MTVVGLGVATETTSWGNSPGVKAPKLSGLISTAAFSMSMANATSVRCDRLAVGPLPGRLESDRCDLVVIGERGGTRSDALRVVDGRRVAERDPPQRAPHVVGKLVGRENREILLGGDRHDVRRSTAGALRDGDGSPFYGCAVRSGQSAELSRCSGRIRRLSKKDGCSNCNLRERAPRLRGIRRLSQASARLPSSDLRQPR